MLSVSGQRNAIAGRFPFRFDPSYLRLARLFGVTPDRAWVDVGPDELVARFGRWLVRTPMANIASVDATGPYSFFKTAGPARLSITDRGLTFATNGDRGVRIAFAAPVALSIVDLATQVTHIHRPSRAPTTPRQPARPAPKTFSLLLRVRAVGDEAAFAALAAG